MVLGSTCKRWNRLFKDAGFTGKHFDKAPKQFFVLMLKGFRVYSSSVNLHGEPYLINSHPNSNQVITSRVFHCDGLLLCINNCASTTIMVWNSCTGQTRRIQPRDRYKCYTYSLGSYQDKKSRNSSYKILCHRGYGHSLEFRISEINSNSWRTLDVTHDCYHLEYNDCSVSLKGNTYWFAWDEKEKQKDIFLLSFDYTSERFVRMHLPYQCPCYHTVSLSVIKEEKLSVLLQRESTSRTEIWVTNKIDETKVISWNMVLAVDLKPELGLSHCVSFFIDEEEKVGFEA